VADTEHDAGHALRGLVEPGKRSDSPLYAFLTVSGVPVALRALNPIGETEVSRQFGLAT